ncbi:zinc finger protein 423-like [Anthonomus grandis grandis]|uniref:zinc finger protein 423-like n=1 Tax=Anthonomus grandis grandis TaxID=2921223 RepID=UPI002164F80C|nr:zinc finger protein 423-like [Anthonomus grandis grandis]
MKMLFKGHSSRLELLIEKIHSNKESFYQDSEISGSSSSEIQPSNNENITDLSLESPKSQNISDSEEDRDLDDSYKTEHDDLIKDPDSTFLQFSCPYCPRQFKHKRSKDRHIKLHTGDKKYKCVQCDSAFARSDHLKIHMKTHDVRKQFKCNKCNKGYNTLTAFSFHEKSHKHDAESLKIESGAEESEEFDLSQKLDDSQKSEEVIRIEPSNGLKRSQENMTNPRFSIKKYHYENPLSCPETFICSCCYERLPNFKSFLIHMESHVPAIQNKSSYDCEEEASDLLINCLSASSMVPLNNTLCCCYCNKFFEDNGKLQEHLIEFHVTTLLKCSLCMKIFEDMTLLKAHMKANHMSTKDHFECSCGSEPKLFHDKASAELHWSKYHALSQSDNNQDNVTMEAKELRIREDYLDRVSKNSTGIASHHRCLYCKEFCKSKNELQLHLRSHQVSEKSRHKCNICDETYSCSTELASHKLVHCKIVEGNICVSCKTIIMDEESFVKHQLKHNDNSRTSAKLNIILPSICIICGQTLQSDREIELHAKFHLKFLSEQAKTRISEPTSQEELCYSSNGKTQDVTSVIDSALELQCHLCKKSFSTKETLQIHLIEHNFFGINQFTCYVCSAVFTGAARLQSHLLAHNLAEKPYQCPQCSISFFFRAELDNHKYLHTFKFQFDCLSDESIMQAQHFTNVWASSDDSDAR